MYFYKLVTSVWKHLIALSLWSKNCPLILQGCLVLLPFKERSHLHWRNAGYLSRRVSASVTQRLGYVVFCLFPKLTSNAPPGGHLGEGSATMKSGTAIFRCQSGPSICPLQKARGIYAGGRGALTALVAGKCRGRFPVSCVFLFSPLLVTLEVNLELSKTLFVCISLLILRPHYHQLNLSQSLVHILL